MPVTLIDSMGDDLRFVNCARVSLGKHSEGLSEADKGLISRMMRDKHGSVFEHVVFTFRVETSIKVAREWFRHRIGSFNEISTRYVEMSDDFYLPDEQHVRKQSGKAMDYTFANASAVEAEGVWQMMDEAYANAYESYKNLLDYGVAKELASFVLPLGLITQFYWTVNARSLFNFLSLRTAPSALREIRDEAGEVERLVSDVIPVTMAAWNKHGRNAV